MSPLAKEIVNYSVQVTIAFDQAKTGRDELRLGAVLSLLAQAQVLAQNDEDESARRLYNSGRNLAKLKQKAEEK